MNGVTGGSQLSQPGRERAACQGSLECEAGALLRELADACEHDASGGNGGAVRIECREPLAITSALTNSLTASIPCNRSGATVDFPAPFGPRG